MIEAVSLFVFIAGFIVGLGAVTVIDLHGLLARKSEYWTQATIQTHKITKPLIWLGITLAAIGGSTYYYPTFPLHAQLHLALLALLTLNGCFLSFKISPYLLKQEKSSTPSKILPLPLQHKITVSFIFSFLGWWGALAVLVHYLITL